MCLEIRLGLRKQKSSPRAFDANDPEEPYKGRKSGKRGEPPPRKVGAATSGYPKKFEQISRGGGIVGENSCGGKRKAGQKKDFFF